MLLGRAGLAAIERTAAGHDRRDGAAPVLVDLPAPLGPCAANVGDVEIRTQATVGGNLCAGEGPDARAATCKGVPAVAATVRSAGAGGVEEPLEDFLAREARPNCCST